MCPSTRVLVTCPCSESIHSCWELSLVLLGEVEINELWSPLLELEGSGDEQASPRETAGDSGHNWMTQTFRKGLWQLRAGRQLRGLPEPGPSRPGARRWRISPWRGRGVRVEQCTHFADASPPGFQQEVHTAVVMTFMPAMPSHGHGSGGAQSLAHGR